MQCMGVRSILDLQVRSCTKMKWLKTWAKISWRKAVLFMLVAMCGTGLNIALSPYREPVEKKDDKLILALKATGASNMSNWEQIVSVDSYLALAKKTILRKTDSSELEKNLEDSHINYTIRSCISALLSNYKEDSHVQQAFSNCSRELMQFIAVIISMPSSLNSTIQVEMEKPLSLSSYKLSESKISQMQSRWDKYKETVSASLGFIKPYKVGGSTISTLLNSYSVSQNRVIQPKWPAAPGKTLGNGNVCFDIVGTHHPKKYFYQSIIFEKAKLFFCNKLILFTLVRDPIERIWSSYNHYVKVNKQIQVSLLDYLRSGHEGLLPPHQLISERLVDALHLSKDLLILSSDGENMDKSLVLLSKKANLSLCDVLYQPCSEKENYWKATKCNFNKKRLEKASKESIIRYLSSTDETKFYIQAKKIFEQELINYDVETTLKQYKLMRTQAMKACSSEISKTAWQNLFLADPRIQYDNREHVFHLSSDKLHLVSPLWVCMQMYCRILI